MSALKSCITAFKLLYLLRKEMLMMKKRERIAVIGAGIAGLSAAVMLEKHGYQVMVYEAS